MVRTFAVNKIQADVIILGCSLPGIVTAHKLKKRFGNTMDIVVLDLSTPLKMESKTCNVVFQEFKDSEDDEETTEQETTMRLIDNVAKYFLKTYAKEFHLPLPDEIIAPERVKSPLTKLFQDLDGKTIECAHDFHDFDYLNFIEKFELSQYQTLLDENMKQLFQANLVDVEKERNRLKYYDQTSMEKHICDALLFTKSREIMRITVRLVCGAAADTVSVLFYLHQCFRTSTAKNHLDGNNTRFREKLLGYCRKRLANKLQQSIADITLRTKPIENIRTCPDEKVILETIKGGTTYVCNLLAMALSPKELCGIRLEEHLLTSEQTDITRNMESGQAKKFVIQYEQNFWIRQGYSGDILSVRGPIIWAMERPILSTTGSTDRYSTLIGFLMKQDDDTNSKEAVIQQLVKLFGDDAASPITYRETNISDVFIPRCGDYVALRQLTGNDSPKYLEWGTLDVFADGDVVAALEAGHSSYLHLISCLRPQAQTYEDLRASEWPTILGTNPLPGWFANVNVINGIKWTAICASTLIAMRLFLYSFSRK